MCSCLLLRAQYAKYIIITWVQLNPESYFKTLKPYVGEKFNFSKTTRLFGLFPIRNEQQDRVRTHVRMPLAGFTALGMMLHHSIRQSQSKSPMPDPIAQAT
jgi:hypothetical protein